MNYYVYAYVRLDSNTYFYIGKGTGKRVTEFYGRSKHFLNILDSVPCAYEILYNNLTEQQALDLEMQTIDELLLEGYSLEIDSDRNQGFNHLVNCTLGGEGVSGYRQTPESIAKSVHYGKDNGMYGRKGHLCPSYGKTHTEEHNNKIREGNPRSTKVKCIELDIEAKSYREMEKILLNDYDIVCYHGTIASICKGKNWSGGYYKDNNEKANLH